MRKGTSQKGQRYETFIANNLRLMNYAVYQVRKNRRRLRNGRFINIGEDIFASDLIAKKRGEKTLWIQVTTGYRLKEKTKKFIDLDCWGRYDKVIIILAIEKKATVEWKTYELKMNKFKEVENFWDIEKL